MSHLVSHELCRGREAKRRLEGRSARFVQRPPIEVIRVRSAAPDSLLPPVLDTVRTRVDFMQRHAVRFTSLGWFSAPLTFVALFVVCYGLTYVRRK
jgi:hypothetical protein